MNRIYERETGNDWNRVYECKTNADYEKWTGENKKYYNSIGEKVYATIDSCVEHALKEGNHVAFAKYYIWKAQKQSNVLKQWFKDKKIKRDERWKIMEEDYWRDFTIDYTPDRYCYSKSTINSWFDGTRLPKKSSIVQLGFYLKFDVNKVNELLQVSGNEMLYALDPMDAVAMFYLNAYADDDTKSGEEKVKIVKEKMVQYVQLNKSMIDIAKKNKYSKKEQTEAPKVVAYSEPIGCHIWEHMKKVYENIQMFHMNVMDIPEELPDYLTKIYEYQIESCKKESNFKEFMEGNIFGFSRYGYFKTMNAYMKKGNCKKNLYCTDYPLTKNITDVRLDNSIFKNRHAFVEPYFVDVFNKLKMQEELSQVQYTKVINTIWKYNSIPYRVADAENIANGRSVVKNIISGRNILKDDKDQYYAKDGVEDAYVFEIKKKCEFIKYCIACGWEDEIVTLLKVANYWNKDYINGKEQGVLERTDALLIYAMRYRDRLLKEWTMIWKNNHKNTGRNSTEFQKKAKDEFPMIRLLLTISRDIQFVLAKIDDWMETGEFRKPLIYEIGDGCDQKGYEQYWYCDFKKKLEKEQKKQEEKKEGKK